MPWSFSNTGIGGGFGISSSGNPGGMTFAYPEIVTNGLLFNLDAGNSTSYPGSGTTWTDISGNSINGTLVNGPTFNSANGGSIVFDGSDDYGIFGTSTFPSGNSPFTMEAIFKFNGLGSNTFLPILYYGRDTNNNDGPLIFIDGSSKFAMDFGSGAGLVTSTSTISTGTWYHVCGKYTLSQVIIYINGALNNSVNYSAANITLNNAINGNSGGIGTKFSGFGNLSSPQRYNSFNGNIAKVALYNRALTDGEVLQNFNALRGRFGI